LTEVNNIECLKEKSDTVSELRVWAKEVLTLLVEWYRALNNDPSVALPSIEESPAVEVWVGEKAEGGQLIGAELEPYCRHLNWQNPINSGLSKRNLARDGIQTLTQALEHGRELSLYQRLLLEARELAYLSRNYALSVVVTGTALEVLVAHELQAACERKQITELQVGKKKAPSMKNYRQAIQDGRLREDLLVRFPIALCGVSLKGLPQYGIWLRDAYDPRNEIIHGGRRGAKERDARRASEAVTAFADAIIAALRKDPWSITKEIRTSVLFQTGAPS